MDTVEGIGLRKRARSDPDDCEECMPISKRINNLHIRHSTESWEPLDHQLGDGFNNNIPGDAPCCQLSPESLISRRDVSPPQHPSLISPAAYHPRSALIPGSALGHVPLHYAHAHMVPDINHNNPLLSPMPRQPCPSSVFPTQQTSCDGCSQYGYRPSPGDNVNPHYFHVNSMLFQAHMCRMSRVTQGGDPNT